MPDPVMVDEYVDCPICGAFLYQRPGQKFHNAYLHHFVHYGVRHREIEQQWIESDESPRPGSTKIVNVIEEEGADGEFIEISRNYYDVDDTSSLDTMSID